MSASLRILLLADDGPQRGRAADLLGALDGGVDVHATDGPLRFAEALADQTFDLVVVTERLGWTTAGEVLELLRGRCADVPVVIWSDADGPEAPIKAFRTGAADVVLRSDDSEAELRDAIGRLHRLQQATAGLSGPAGPASQGWHAALDDAGVAAFRWDPAGRDLRQTQVLEELLGPVQTPPQAPLALLVPDDLLPVVEGQLKTAGRARMDGVTPPKDPRRRLSLELSRRDGVTFGVIRDVTERERLSRELSDALYAADTAKSQAEETRLALERAQAMQDELTVLAHGLAHDLAEPLRSIDRRLEQLADQVVADSADSATAAIDAIRAQVAGLADLTRSHLARSHRPDATPRTSGSTASAGSPVADGQRVLAEVRRNLAELIASRGARVQATDLPVVGVAPTHLLQILQNLISNAIHHDPNPQPQVRVRALRQAASWWWTVEDDGPGIPHEDRPQVFEARWRGSKSDGTGIGLAVCQSIVTQYGGRIWISDERDHGTTVCFTMPHADEHERSEQEPTEQLPALELVKRG